MVVSWCWWLKILYHKCYGLYNTSTSNIRGSSRPIATSPASNTIGDKHIKHQQPLLYNKGQILAIWLLTPLRHLWGSRWISTQPPTQRTQRFFHPRYRLAPRGLQSKVLLRTHFLLVLFIHFLGLGATKMTRFGIGYGHVRIQPQRSEARGCWSRCRR